MAVKNKPTPYGALCEAIFAFHKEMSRLDLKHSLIVHLDPPTYQAVMYSMDPILGSTVMPGDNLRIMDAIVMSKPLKL